MRSLGAAIQTLTAGQAGGGGSRRLSHGEAGWPGTCPRGAATSTRSSGSPARRLREARGCGLATRAAQAQRLPAPRAGSQSPSGAFAQASAALGASGWPPGWPQALTVNGPEAPVVRVLHMAPRRHDDKRRTAVRTRGAGLREGAVKGPASISFFYRDSRGVRTRGACAEEEAAVPTSSLQWSLLELASSFLLERACGQRRAWSVTEQ